MALQTFLSTKKSDKRTRWSAPRYKSSFLWFCVRGMEIWTFQKCACLAWSSDFYRPPVSLMVCVFGDKVKDSLAEEKNGAKILIDMFPKNLPDWNILFLHSAEEKLPRFNCFICFNLKNIPSAKDAFCSTGRSPHSRFIGIRILWLRLWWSMCIILRNEVRGFSRRCIDDLWDLCTNG